MLTMHWNKEEKLKEKENIDVTLNHCMTDDCAYEEFQKMKTSQVKG